MVEDKTDPVVALAKLLSIWLPVAAADIAAPQIAVFMAGIAGGCIAVMGWRKCTRLEAMGYATAFGVLAWLFASALTGLAVMLWPALDNARNLPHLVAALIGGIGHRWPKVGAWAVRLLAAPIRAALPGGRE